MTGLIRSSEGGRLIIIVCCNLGRGMKREIEYRRANIVIKIEYRGKNYGGSNL